MNERELYAIFQTNNVEDFIQSLEDYDKEIAHQMIADGYKYKNKAQRTVLFTFGEVTFSRNRWYKGQECRVPVDEKLGLLKNTRYSMELLYQIAELSTRTPYRKVVEIVELMYQVHITKDTVLKAVKFGEQLLRERELYRFYQESKEVNKIKAQIIYIEGDGVLVKSSEPDFESRHIDLAHFVIHTGSYPVTANRFQLQNKKEIVSLSSTLARDQVLDYLYNNYEITENTILITNSDGGKGYTPYVFKEIAQALGIKRHEHFWDAYHVNQKLKRFYRAFSQELLDQAFEAIVNHDKGQLRMVFDTTESLMETEEDMEELAQLTTQFLRNFQYTKSAKLRGLPEAVLGIMESQHRKITYRMKKRGMYWSQQGADRMGQMILLSSAGELRELFLGDWRESYEQYQGLEKFSVARVKRGLKKVNKMIYTTTIKKLK